MRLENIYVMLPNIIISISQVVWRFIGMELKNTCLMHL